MSPIQVEWQFLQNYVDENPLITGDLNTFKVKKIKT